MHRRGKDIKLRGSVMTWTNSSGQRPKGDPRIIGGYKLIRCLMCSANTIARAATSDTLKGWEVQNFPDKCLCPKCFAKEIATIA